MRKAPRDLELYSSAEDAAQSLEEAARRVRKGGGRVKFNLWFYNAPPLARLDEKSSPPLTGKEG